MGHLVRSVRLIEQLARRFEVTFVSGNQVPDIVRLPPDVRLVQLPAVSMGDEGNLVAATDLEATLVERAGILRAVAGRVSPDVVVTELFPFGRHKLAGEILGLLAETAESLHVCSLRDILVSKRRNQEAFDRRAVALLNEHYDALLIHTDARMLELAPLPLGDTITTPRYVTGFVGQDLLACSEVTNEILVSAGGGRVGGPLYRAALEAHRRLYPELGIPMRVVGGPFLSEAELEELSCIAAAGSAAAEVVRAVPCLAAHIASARFTVSQCGYNTALELLGTSAPALVVPFNRGGENEQMIRARHLEALGRVMLLDEHALSVDSMEDALRALISFRPRPVAVDLRGAEQSACVIEDLCGRIPPKSEVRTTLAHDRASPPVHAIPEDNPSALRGALKVTR